MNQAGREIHSPVLRARPEINIVLHSHTRAGVAIHVGFVANTLSTHPFQDSTAVAVEGEALADDLGSNYLMLLQNHDILALGRTTAEVFMYHYHLEAACKIQVDVLAAIDAPVLITPPAMEQMRYWGAPENGP